MKVIVTGATGFIGRYLVDELLKKNCEVVAVIRPNSKNRCFLPEHQNLYIVELDMECYRDLSSVITGSYDVMYLCSWNGVRGTDRNDIELQKKNYAYSIDAIEQAIAIGCKKIIFLGSQAEYGKSVDVVDENCICRPIDEYGRWKYQLGKTAEDICRRHSIDFFHIRIFSLYGIGDYHKAMIPSTIDKLLNYECVNLSSCEQYWNYLYIGDAANVLAKFAVESFPSGVYNLASSDTKKLKEYTKQIWELCGMRGKLLYAEWNPQNESVVHLRPDISKITNVTGWQPQVSFNEGICQIIESIGKTNEKNIDSYSNL